MILRKSRRRPNGPVPVVDLKATIATTPRTITPQPPASRHTKAKFRNINQISIPWREVIANARTSFANWIACALVPVLAFRIVRKIFQTILILCALWYNMVRSMRKKYKEIS